MIYLALKFKHEFVPNFSLHLSFSTLSSLIKTRNSQVTNSLAFNCIKDKTIEHST